MPSHASFVLYLGVPYPAGEVREHVEELFCQSDPVMVGDIAFERFTSMDQHDGLGVQLHRSDWHRNPHRIDLAALSAEAESLKQAVAAVLLMWGIDDAVETYSVTDFVP